VSGARKVDVSADADVGVARRAVRAAAAEMPADVGSRAELVVTELVTNALLHGGGRARVTVVPIEGGLRLEVRDDNRRELLTVAPSAEGMTGRGVALVGRLATAWGVEPTDDGKIVWAHIINGIGGDGRAGVVAEAQPWGFDDDRPPTVRVSLGEVPTGLLVAAKRHVDNLVREFRLAAGGGRSGMTAPLPGPLAELIDRVVNRFEDARVEIKRQATAAARSGRKHTRLELDLPVDVADAAEEYVQALDEVDAYSKANRLLTLETPPQHRVFRRWYIGEIVKQLRAEAAGLERPPVVSFEDRLLAEVDAAERARITAEQAARLYTVAVALAGTLTQEEVASAVLNEGVEALRASGGGLLLATGTSGISVPGTVGYDSAMVERLRHESRDAELPAAHALRTGEAVWLETVEERNERFPALRGFEPDTTAMCAMPLAAGGTVLGALRFSFTDRRLFDRDEQQFVLALAAEAAEALERARLLESERDARRRLEHERASLEKLAAVGEAMLRGRDLQSILQLATDAATQVSGAQVGAFLYSALDGRDESLLYTVSGVDRSVFEPFALPRHTAIFGPTFRAESTMRLDDVTQDPRYGLSAPFHGLPDGHPPVRSYLAVPVTLSTGEVVGGLFFGHEEVGRFGPEHERLVVGVAGQAAAAVETVRSMDERVRVAATLQQSLLPAVLPDVAGLELGAAYAAADAVVGGDFYDVFPLADGSWGVAIGDVRGRGPEAAAVTAMARYTMRTAAQLGRTPAGVCRVLADAMDADGDPEHLCSVIVGAITVGSTSAVLVCANAGHPPGVVLRRDGIEHLPPTGSVIGAFASESYGEHTILLQPGDAVVLYTDGVSEARRGDEELGDHRLYELLREQYGRPSQEVADAVMAESRSFSSTRASDDAAVFVLRVRTEA
jgi:serine phosphatase RsbU (regulator of sigma subunit)/anti-sigma regulatory factor (Ser/Thr protein kinase)